MKWPPGLSVLLGTSSYVSYSVNNKSTLTRHARWQEFDREEEKKTDGNVCPTGDMLDWAVPSLLLGLISLLFYAAPIARRCWKHSRQNTGRPCVGRKGTVVSFPHCEQLVFVSERIGEAWPPPPPPSARFALHALQRFGSFLKP